MTPEDMTPRGQLAECFGPEEPPFADPRGGDEEMSPPTMCFHSICRCKCGRSGIVEAEGCRRKRAVRCDQADLDAGLSDRIEVRLEYPWLELVPGGRHSGKPDGVSVGRRRDVVIEQDVGQEPFRAARFQRK
jgi:hypothetical protein